MIRTRWIGSILLFSGMAIFALSLGLGGLAYCAKWAADNTEWVTIGSTGHPSHPEAIRWSAWQTGGSDLSPFMFSGRPDDEAHANPISEYRVGRDGNWLLDFVCYEGRVVVDGRTYAFPAEGPGWGVHVHWWWLLMGATVGAGCLAASYWHGRPQGSMRVNAVVRSSMG